MATLRYAQSSAGGPLPVWRHPGIRATRPAAQYAESRPQVLAPGRFGPPRFAAHRHRLLRARASRAA
eukprot:4796930-Alexandrium_andersonii.AAC.1